RRGSTPRRAAPPPARPGGRSVPAPGAPRVRPESTAPTPRPPAPPGVHPAAGGPPGGPRPRRPAVPSPAWSGLQSDGLRGAERHGVPQPRLLGRTVHPVLQDQDRALVGLV